MSDIKDTTNSNYDEDFHFDDVEDAAHDYTAPNAAQSAPGAASAGSAAGVKSNLGPDASFKGSFFDDVLGAQSKWHIQPQNSRKFIILGIVVVIVLFFIVYHFVSNWSNPFSGLHHGSGSKASNVVAVPNPAQIAQAEQQAKDAAEKAKIEAFENKSNALDQTLNQQQQTINQLQTNMEALQESVNTVNNSVGTLSQKMDALDSKLTKPVVRPLAKSAPVAPPINYIIRAMVPGRAWLQGSNGSSLSVAVGNEVPGHGTVTDIELNSGQVMMSDGSVFSYDTNGN